MSFLKDLDEERRELLVSLPYRVGLWISQCDDAGGAESDAQELQTLSNLLHGIAEEIFGAETVQHIISGTISEQPKWQEWSRNLDSVLDDCRQGIALLERTVDPKEVNAFRRHLFEVGEAVALAFREHGQDMPLADRGRMYVSYYMGAAKAYIRGTPHRSLDEFLKISIRERAALAMLRESLGMDKKPRKPA